jgi:universal stress protein A
MCARLQEENEPSSADPVRDLRLKRILVPTDFSESAEHALNYAVGLSRPYRAEILVLHVFQLREYLSLLSEKAQVDSDTANEVLEAAKRRVAEQLEKAVQRFGAEDVVMLPVLETGVPYEEIVKYAAEREVDLIVMPTHARTGLAHFFMGSTAQRVISHAVCPVVVVKGLPPVGGTVPTEPQKNSRKRTQRTQK